MRSESMFKKKVISSKSWLNILTFVLIAHSILLLPETSQAAKVTDFIPEESIGYVQINDLDEVYNEIKMSEQWEMIYEQLVGESERQDLQNGLLLIQNIIGTDVFTVIETVGYQIGFALWLDEYGKQQAGIIFHSGGNLAELKRFTKIATGLIGMSEGRLTLDAGEHRKVKYDTLQMPDFLLTYGFVGDFLVLGIQENSFEKMIDTYRKKSDSIRRNESYVETTKSMDSGVVSLYIDVPDFLSYLGNIDEATRNQLEAITNFSAVLNLLENGPILQLQAKVDRDASESYVSRFLIEGEELSTLKSLSGNEDLFISVAPRLTAAVWDLLYQEMENSETDDAFAFITFLEGILNLNFNEDVIAGLTGEIALTVDDLYLFEPDSLDNLNLEFFDSFHIDADSVSTNGGLIFNSKNKEKWDQLGNSLSNLQNTSVSKMDYNDTEIAVFTSSIYLAEKDGFSLLSFSEDQMISMIDGFNQKKKLPMLKLAPKNPLAFVKLNMMKFAEVVSEGQIIIDESIEEVSPLLAWISVKEDVAKFEVVVSEKNSPLEEILKLVPFLVSNIE